ncbi:MAG TPA: hypothetical protein VIX12_05990 [Candidatus Binataceae bacterium]
MARRFSIFCLIVVVFAARSFAAASGTLKLDVLGDLGAGAKNPAQVVDSSGKQVGQVTPGAAVDLPPGNYRLVMPIIGGQITKDDVTIESGRTHTVLIQNVAVLDVSMKNKEGKDEGFGVTVTSTDPPHATLLTGLTGDKYLFAPNLVDVKVDAPPQGMYWHAVRLVPGQRAHLTLTEEVPAELTVQSVLSKTPIDNSTRVVVYKAGTQTQVAEGAQGAPHVFKLDPGNYDVYVENHAGKGRPYATDTGIHLDSGVKVERTVPLD